MARKKSSRIRLHEEDKAVLDEIKQMTTTSAQDIQRLKRGTEITNAALNVQSKKLQKISKDIKRTQGYMKRSAEVLNEKINAQEKRLTKVKNKIKKIDKNTDPTGKVQGIFDFTFAIVTITMAILLIPNPTTKLIGIIFASLGILIYLILASSLYFISLKLNIRAITTLQIILSILALIIFMVNSNGE